MQGMINIYMSYYRREFPEVRVIPKQHLLESHCVPWIQVWVFGLSLHGEQGGEGAQATVNCLKKTNKQTNKKQRVTEEQGGAVESLDDGAHDNGVSSLPRADAIVIEKETVVCTSHPRQ